jgi:hypothetical protein
MEIKTWKLNRNSRVRMLTAVLVSVGSITVAAIGQSVASQGEWISLSRSETGTPIRNSRLNQHPRPASAPVSSAGNPAMLTGEIEPWPAPRQPRPLSAAPKRLDGLVTSLNEAWQRL